MATKEQLERALRNADKAGDVAAAKRFASAIRNGEFQQEKSLIQKAGDFAMDYAVNPALEGMAAVNRGATGIVDFLASPVNAAMELSGSNARVPSLTKALEPYATGGNFMEQGLGRDVVRAAGEAVPAALAVGGALRAAAQPLTGAVTGQVGNVGTLPQLATGSESVGAGVLRQMGSSTAAQDAGFAALSGAGSAVGREVGGEEGSMIGAIAAPAAVTIAAKLGGEAIKKIFAGGNQQAIAKSIDDFAFIGETPTVGMATGSPAFQKAETVSGSVMGGGRLRAKSESIAENIQKRVADMADNLSTKIGAEAAGLEIKKGIQGRGGFLDRFRTSSSALWNKADQMIDPALSVDTTNTKSMLDQLVRKDNFGQILDNPKLVQIQQVLDEAPNVDYGTLKSLRTSIGQKIGNNELISDIPRAELKMLYGALTQDIKTAAASSSHEALKAFERANAYTRTGHDRIDDYLERIATKVDTDKIFNAVAKGGEGTKTINAVKRSLKPEEWEVVASNVIRRMGRANSGAQNAEGDAFSIDKFVTDWDKLGAAKKALFSGSENLNSYYDDLSKIARVASTVKYAGKQGANYSGTVQAGSRIAAGAGLAGGVATLDPVVLSVVGSSIAMNNAGARLMTNPKFVKWLAQSSRIPARNSAAAIGSLVNVANQSSADDAAIIQQLAEELESKK
jgi:hypothetical protein